MWDTIVSIVVSAVSWSLDLLWLCTSVHRICWPYAGDQPTTSAHLTCNLKVAFELIEVWTGPDGLKPMPRNIGLAARGMREAMGKEFREVNDACRGKQGDELKLEGKCTRDEAEI